MLALSSSSDAMTGETVRAIEDKTAAEEMLPEAENEADEDDDGGNDEETEEKTED